jgi:hypothetical protein
MLKFYKKLRANFPKYKNLLKLYSSSFFDKIIYHISKKKVLTSDGSRLKNILYVTEDPRIDIIRFFNAQKKVINARYILLINHSNLDPLFNEAGFDEIHFFRNNWNFRERLKKLNDIDIVHGFTRRCSVINIIKKEHHLPVIINAKDTSVNSHGLNPPHWYLKEELPEEKACFNNVEAIVSESLEVSNAFRLFGLQKRAKRIYFANYCEASKNQSNKTKISDKDVHLVYVGSVRGSQDNPKEHGNIQLHWLIDSLNKQRIHLHVYPNPNMDKVVYEEYFDLDKKMPYFHMHESLKPSELINEIKEYHYGIIPFFNEDTNRSPMKRYYSTSLKLFNYSEAGLPVLISNDMGHQRWVLERYGMAIGMDKNEFHNLGKKLEEKEYSSIQNTLIKNRKILTIENQIHRIKTLYISVLKKWEEDQMILK